jgi:hypothetical protein
MIIFAVMTPQDNNSRLEAAMALSFSDNFIKVGPGQYLVAGKGTAIDVSNALGITDGTNGAERKTKGEKGHPKALG